TTTTTITSTAPSSNSAKTKKRKKKSTVKRRDPQGAFAVRKISPTIVDKTENRNRRTNSKPKTNSPQSSADGAKVHSGDESHDDSIDLDMISEEDRQL